MKKLTEKSVKDAEKRKKEFDKIQKKADKKRQEEEKVLIKERERIEKIDNAPEGWFFKFYIIYIFSNQIIFNQTEYFA